MKTIVQKLIIALAWLALPMFVQAQLAYTTNNGAITGGNFGFNLIGPTNAVIIVEACTNLSNPAWLPVATNTFSASGTSTFTDPSTLPSRFYRFRSP